MGGAMKKLPFLMALAANHMPSSMFPKARKRAVKHDPVADMTAITKAQQKRARRAEKLAKLSEAPK